MACELEGAVYAIDVVSRQVATRVLLDGFPNGAAYDAASRSLFVSLGRGAAVAVLDGTTLAVRERIAVGERPWNMAVDAGRLLVANGRSGTVSVIETATGTVHVHLVSLSAKRSRIADIAVGRLPWGVALR